MSGRFRGLPPFEDATFTRFAMLPLDDIAQSDGGGSPPFEVAIFNRSAMLPSDNMAQSNGARVGPKGPKCWPQASAGDYKGAQPPYLAD